MNTLRETKKRGYSTAEAASYLSVSPSLLRQGRMVNSRMDAPRHIKVSTRKIIYLKEDLDAWLDKKAAEGVA